MEKGLLVVSFGTSYEETRRLTLDRIEEDLAKSFPDRKFYKAWTSKTILKKIKERDGVEFDNIQEAISRLKADGIRDVLVQPTHILNGIEDNKIRAAFQAYDDLFDVVKIGDALLYGEESFSDMGRAIKKIFSFVKPDEAIVLVGHGTKHKANDAYSNLEKSFHASDMKNIFIVTIEGEDDIESVLPILSDISVKKVWLTPFLIVAGDHANNDICGDGEESCRTVLENADFTVSCIKKGLGEYEEIRNIFVKHAKEMV